MADEQYIGFLPYGSDDPSVILADPLTTFASLDAAVTAAGGTLTEHIAASDFDSAKGFKPQGSPGNGSSGYSIDSMTRQGELKQGGQVCFEIESAFFTVLDADASSTGEDTFTGRTQPPYCFCAKSAAAKFNGIGVEKHDTLKYPIISNATDKSSANIDRYVSRHLTAGSGSAYANSQSYGEFVLVNIYWYRDGVETVFVMAFDGEIILRRKSANASTEADDLWANIYLGSLIASAAFVNWHSYMRNFQISSRVPAFGRMENAGKTVFWSDSLFAKGDANGQSNRWGNAETSWGSCNVAASFNRTFNNVETGVLSGDMWIHAYGGESLLGASPQSANLPAVLVNSPDVIVFLTGTNDASTIDYDAWETELQDNIITPAFAAGVRTFVLCTIPSQRYRTDRDNPTNVAHTAAMNAKVNAQTAWDSRVFVADLFTAFGGESGLADYWIGGFIPGGDDLHWHSTGQEAAGREIARALKQHVGLV